MFMVIFVHVNLLPLQKKHHDVKSGLSIMSNFNLRIIHVTLNTLDAHIRSVG